MSYKLLVDLGNSRLKWAHWRDSRLHEGGGAVHAGADLSQVLQRSWAELDVPGAVCIASVGSVEQEQSVREWIKDHWPDAAVQFPRTESEAHGVTCAYRDPRSMGVDRWLALIAARAQFNGALCVADIGTAVTLDALDANGQHLGGLIVPGFNLAREALIGNTALVRTSTEPRQVTRADNTQDAIFNGTRWAIVALIERFVHDLKHESNQDVMLYVTGGDGVLLHSSLRIQCLLTPDLVLQGLSIVCL